MTESTDPAVAAKKPWLANTHKSLFLIGKDLLKKENELMNLESGIERISCFSTRLLFDDAKSCLRQRKKDLVHLRTFTKDLMELDTKFEAILADCSNNQLMGPEPTQSSNHMLSILPPSNNSGDCDTNNDNPEEMELVDNSRFSTTHREESFLSNADNGGEEEVEPETMNLTHQELAVDDGSNSNAENNNQNIIVANLGVDTLTVNNRELLVNANCSFPQLEIKNEPVSEGEAERATFQSNQPNKRSKNGNLHMSNILNQVAQFPATVHFNSQSNNSESVPAIRPNGGQGTARKSTRVRIPNVPSRPVTTNQRTPPKITIKTRNSPITRQSNNAPLITFNPVLGDNQQDLEENENCSMSISDPEYTPEQILAPKNSAGKSKNKQKSGFVTCAICTYTKHYASARKRLGTEACDSCFFWFWRFIRNPRQLYCVQNGLCKISGQKRDQADRCCACWLRLCLTKFEVEESVRKLIYEKFSPKIRAQGILYNS